MCSPLSTSGTPSAQIHKQTVHQGHPTRELPTLSQHLLPTFIWTPSLFCTDRCFATLCLQLHSTFVCTHRLPLLTHRMLPTARLSPAPCLLFFRMANSMRSVFPPAVFFTAMTVHMRACTHTPANLAYRCRHIVSLSIVSCTAPCSPVVSPTAALNYVQQQQRRNRSRCKSQGCKACARYDAAAGQSPVNCNFQSRCLHAVDCASSGAVLTYSCSVHTCQKFMPFKAQPSP